MSQQFAKKLNRLKELFSKRQYLKILSICDNLIKNDPVTAEAYAFRGLALEEMGWVHEAIANYSQAIELDPNYSSPLRDRGLIYLRLGNEVLAREDLETYKSMRNEDDNFLQTLIIESKARPFAESKIKASNIRLFKNADNMVIKYLASFLLILGLLLWHRNSFQPTHWGFKVFLSFTLIFLLSSIWRWLQIINISKKPFGNLMRSMIRYCSVSKQKILLNSLSRVNVLFSITLFLGLLYFPLEFYFSMLALSWGVIISKKFTSNNFVSCIIK
ncbi:MAG: tetratricopeptide repeat protein [Saprospiraceae bacterium]|nr:tetratricopeptide repeat protein [Saprospiraceae bacterium]